MRGGELGWEVRVQVSMWVSDRRRQVAWRYCVLGKGSHTGSDDEEGRCLATLDKEAVLHIKGVCV